MAIRQLRYEGDGILSKKCREVTVVDDKIRELLDDMLDTLHTMPNGAAIAACQVGILKRLVVIDMGDGVIKLVNPKIIAANGVQESIEGCLSFPNKAGITVRPKKVTVQALNEFGEEILLEGEDLMAKCLCHEIEHLDGRVFLEHVISFVDMLK